MIPKNSNSYYLQDECLLVLDLNCGVLTGQTYVLYVNFTGCITTNDVLNFGQGNIALYGVKAEQGQGVAGFVLKGGHFN